MSITDELREWADLRIGTFPCQLRDEFTAIADRIDAEHEAKVSYWQGASYKDGYDEGFASADDWIAQHEDAMAEHGWVRLPVDADGEVIHVGDKVDSDYYEDGTVTGIQFYETANGGIRTRIAVRPDGWDTATWYAPDGYRHYHKPTVEDVLREFAAKLCIRDGFPTATEETFAEYAAKLQLREDA